MSDKSISQHYQELAAKVVDEWDGQDTEELIKALEEELCEEIRPVNARLLAAARFYRETVLKRLGWSEAEHDAAIAEAERAVMEPPTAWGTGSVSGAAVVGTVPREPTWTSERPTVPGWYWVDFGRGVTTAYYNEHAIRHMKDWGTHGGRFSGPLAPPPAPGGET